MEIKSFFIRFVIALWLAVSASAASAVDEVLYFMVDDPTINDRLEKVEYRASEAESYGRVITDARVAAFLTSQAGNYSAITHDEVDVLYLDLYFDRPGEGWTVDHGANPLIDSAFVSGGRLGTGAAAYGMASLSDPSLAGVDISLYSFAIELGSWSPDADDPDASWVVVATSELGTYDSLAQFRSTELHIQGQMPWTPVAYAVPEPTSGLLALVGFALLVLRRGKVEARG